MAVRALTIATVFLAVPAMAQPDSARKVLDSESAIVIAREACGANRHFQKWGAISTENSWEVKGSSPLRFTSDAECHVTVPKDGSAPSNKVYLMSPKVAECTAPVQGVCF
jgi:hypothetical protein